MTMTRWQHMAVVVYHNSEFKTGRMVPQRDTSFWGGIKQVEEVSPMWCAKYDGRDVPLDQFLEQVGEEGWEIAGTAPYDLRIGGGVAAWYKASH